MRLIRRIGLVLFCCLTLPSMVYVGLSAASGWDPIDLRKDEVADTRTIPRYEFVHHPRLAALVDETKAIEPDSGWDAQWVLDGVIVRSRHVGTEELEFEWEADAGLASESEIVDTLANLLAENGFTDTDR